MDVEGCETEAEAFDDIEDMAESMEGLRPTASGRGLLTREAIFVGGKTGGESVRDSGRGRGEVTLRKVGGEASRAPARPGWAAVRSRERCDGSSEMKKLVPGVSAASIAFSLSLGLRLRSPVLCLACRAGLEKGLLDLCSKAGAGRDA